MPPPETPEAVIRPATPDDAAPIAHVHVESWRSAYRGILPATLLDRLDKEARRETWAAILNGADDEFSFVAEADGRIIGFAHCGPERRNDPDFAGELYAIYLLDDYHGRGIGSGLFRKCAESLLAQGIQSIKTWVLEDNPYRAFYERRGGVAVGKDTVDIGGMSKATVAYGWAKLGETVSD